MTRNRSASRSGRVVSGFGSNPARESVAVSAASIRQATALTSAHTGVKAQVRGVNLDIESRGSAVQLGVFVGEKCINV